MRNTIYLSLCLILLLALVACTPEPSTPTAAPSQTPFVLVVTATASFTPVPSPSPTITLTAAPPPTASILDQCALRTDWPVYRVRVGDTLSTLAVRTHSTVTSLQLANCIADINMIRVGQTLYVPQLPSETNPIVEDLISDFSVNLSEALAGTTVVFTWEAEPGTVIEIRHVTGNNAFVGSNLAASGSLSYTLPSQLGSLTKLEFVIRGVKAGANGDIQASPYSVFINILVPTATATLTRTATASQTATSTATATVTQTATSTATATVTQTATSTEAAESTEEE